MNTVSTPKPLVKRDELDQILWDVSGEESTKNERTKAKQDIISLIESARREERQRVVEMLRKLKRTGQCTCMEDYSSCPYNIALSDVKEHLGEDHAKQSL